MRQDQGLVPFRWMLDSHSGLHATYFIILQLQDSEAHSDPELDPELLHRGRQTLQAMRDLHPKSESKVWSFLNNEINHVLIPGSSESPELPELPDLGSLDPSFIVADMDFPIIGDWLIYPEDNNR